MTTKQKPPRFPSTARRCVVFARSSGFERSRTQDIPRQWDARLHAAPVRCQYVGANVSPMQSMVSLNRFRHKTTLRHIRDRMTRNAKAKLDAEENRGDLTEGWSRRRKSDAIANHFAR
jgi:hypothetical protein